MPDYIPSPTEWVRKQVEEYEGSGGTQGTTLRGLPVVIVQPGLIYGPGDIGPTHDLLVQYLTRRLPADATVLIGTSQLSWPRPATRRGWSTPRRGMVASLPTSAPPSRSRLMSRWSPFLDRSSSCRTRSHSRSPR